MIKIKNISPKKIFVKKSGLFWFTLVELIVVIVILAILSTIAFISFNSYSALSRDAKRMSNVAMIAKWIDVTIAAGKSLNTSEFSTWNNLIIYWSSWSIFTWIYASQLGKKFLNWINVYWESILNDDFQTYKLSFIPAQKYYQVLALLEKSPDFSYRIDFFSDKVVATWTWTLWYAFLKWNFPINWTWWILWIIPTTEAWETSTGITVWWEILKSISWTWDLVMTNSSTAWATASSLLSEEWWGWTWSTICIFDEGTFDNCAFQ
ncbi:MAG: hypothetical protein ACD_2C00030G0002 [uncultured bacterium (gcode 4)]|uniref:Uncharacterized protein n=1 Tax=uncultured bacterium (gcode 4) TaxID=1234023 RepID=K2GID2_9BACT|nr:MAG: hypothetical protein ACD_2C00030G0002 [uncultured bacterium (gcode 4)]